MAVDHDAVVVGAGICGLATAYVAEAARTAFPSLELDEDQSRRVRFGRPLELELGAPTAVFAPDGEFLALYEHRDGRARPLAVFV